MWQRGQWSLVRVGDVPINLPPLLCSFLHFLTLTHAVPSALALHLLLEAFSQNPHWQCGHSVDFATHLQIDFSVNDHLLWPTAPNTLMSPVWGLCCSFKIKHLQAEVQIISVANKDVINFWSCDHIFVCYSVRGRSTPGFMLRLICVSRLMCVCTCFTQPYLNNAVSVLFKAVNLPNKSLATEKQTC